MKLIDFTLDNIGKLILKRPRESHVGHEYISEVLYLDDETGRLYRPVFQTPKLRVQYGVKQFKEGGIYSYCVGLYNIDIDPEVREFYQVALAYDRHMVSQYQTNKVEWKLTNIRNKYWTAVRRKDRTSDPHLVVKLISDKGGIKTKICSLTRDTLQYTDIVYGMLVDQYISPTYIVFNEGGIYPTWYAHQVVVSQMERVFLERCLLDNIIGYGPSACNQVPPPHLPPHLPPPPLMLLPATHVVHNAVEPPRAMGLGGLIKTADILSAIGKLKKPEPKISQARSDIQELIDD